jgi:50S ribosomal subunit-associated GTPase HflX
VFNKIDRLSGDIDRHELEQRSGSHPFVALSSRDETAVASLREKVLATVRADQCTREVFVPYDQARVTEAIYRSCRVRKSVASTRGTQFVIEGTRHVVEGIARTAREARRR